MNELLLKFRDVFLSIVLITIFVIILNFTVVGLETNLLLQFLLGAFLVFIGLSIFLFGIDLSITPTADQVGKAMTFKGKKWILAIAALVIGFAIAIAEPSLIIFGSQVQQVTAGILKGSTIMIAVAIGFGIAIAIALLRIILGVPLKWILTIVYVIVFILAFNVSNDYLGIAFDAAAATTGSVVVPFLLSLTVSVAAIKSKSGSSEEDSFGLLGITTAIATITTLILGLFINTNNLSGNVKAEVVETHFLEQVFNSLRDVTFALSPIVIMFVIICFLPPIMSKRKKIRITKGLIYSFIGLTIFLSGVYGGFMDVGRVVGERLAQNAPVGIIILVGFILGLLTILAEPAVYVQTKQIEDVTSGSIRKVMVFISLSLGVGLAVGLTMVRILFPSILIWHYLLPFYLIAIVLSFFVPKIFVGISFDAGAVASGPMTATFVLAFCQGVASGTGTGGSMIDGFGMISLVALVPVVVLQILGIVFRIKSRRLVNFE